MPGRQMRGGPATMSGPPKSSVLAKTSCCMSEVCAEVGLSRKHWFEFQQGENVPVGVVPKLWTVCLIEKSQHGRLVGSRRHGNMGKRPGRECLGGGRADAKSGDILRRQTIRQGAKNARAFGGEEHRPIQRAALERDARLLGQGGC